MNGQTRFVIEKLRKWEPRTVLNVGFRRNSRLDIKEARAEIGALFAVLEVFALNCTEILAADPKALVFCMDVRDITCARVPLVDVILWLHGPEHIPWEDFLICRQPFELAALRPV